MATGTTPQPRMVLTSWKEIASYLGKGVRTVQRWEMQFGLPVRRPNEKSKGVVYASRRELDQWLAMHWSQRPGKYTVAEPSNGPVKTSVILEVKASQKLRNAHRELVAQNEELPSANEEIQSGNEELQSTNEELQTSKEELESANEELHTVNEEMQHRNEMLTQLNNDLNNLLNSVNLAMVMVGPDLSVRRFTPQAAKVLGLTSTDVGTPITRLKLKTELDDLERKMLDVIAEVRPKQYRIHNSDGQRCELRLSPCRTADNRIDGVVLSVLTPEEPENHGGPHPESAPAAKRPGNKVNKNKKNPKAGKRK